MKHLEKWERIALLLSLLIIVAFSFIEYKCISLTTRFPVTISILTGVITGLFTTILVFYIQRRQRKRNLIVTYKGIGGEYERIEMGQDNTDGTKANWISKENNGLRITIKYEEGNIFSLIAQYWKTDEAVVNAKFEFDERNKNIAYGRYRYVKGKGPHTGNFGSYIIHRIEGDDQFLYVLYQHIHPRRENNPDTNRGWEVWRKI